MARTSMSQLVRVSQTGEVTTLAKLAEEGRLTFRAEQCEGPRQNMLRTVSTHYFAYVDGTASAFEIGKTAFLSRTGEAVVFGATCGP